MTYIMSCVWLDYMVKYFQCKNCVGSSPKTKKCVASFLVPVYISSIHKGFDFMNTRFFYLIWFYVRSRFSPAPFAMPVTAR